MARYNEILVGRYARAVQKLFGIKGEVPVGSLAGELVVSHGVFNGAENRYLEGWQRFGVAISIAAAAANTSCFRFRNPTTNNVIAVFEKFDISEAAADTNGVLRHGQTATDLATVLNLQGTQFDSRPGSNLAPSIIASQQNTTVGGPVIGGNENSVAIVQLVAATMFPLIGADIQEFPLTAGDAYQFNAGVVNQAVKATVWWRERFVEESERA